MSLRYLTMNQMSEMTGIDRRTIKKRLDGLTTHKGTGKGFFYDAREALPLLLRPDTGKEIDKRMEAEELRYETARADKMQLEVQKLRGEVVDIEEVAKVVEKEYSFVKSQLRSIPTKLAKQLALISDAHQVYERLHDTINECLTELTADIKFEEEREQLERSSTSTSEESKDKSNSSASSEPSSMG